MNRELLTKLQELKGKVFLLQDERYTIEYVMFKRDFYHIKTDKRLFSKTEDSASSFLHNLEIVGEFELEEKPPQKRFHWKKTGVTPYMRRTHEEFMRVRPGETPEQWERRIRLRVIRMAEESENSKVIQDKRAKLRKKAVRVYKKFERNNVIIAHADRINDFLYLYGLMSTWASLKYELDKRDIEVFLYFYKLNRPFERPEFELIVKTIKGKNFKFHYFLKKGYINKIEVNAGGKKQVTSGLYNLSIQVTSRIDYFYKKYLSPPKVENIEEREESYIQAMKIKEILADIKDLKEGKGTKSRIIITE